MGGSAGAAVRPWSSRAESLWAKTGEEPQDWLSLTRHMTDSAEVGRILWREWLAAGVKKRLGTVLGLQEGGEAFAAWLCGVHDVGKCSEAFVGQLEERIGYEEFADRVRRQGLDLSRASRRDLRYPHSAASEQIIQGWLIARGGSTPRDKAARTVAAIAGAHHGLPAQCRHLEAAAVSMRHQGDAWDEVRRELLDGMVTRTGAADAIDRVMTLRRGIPRTEQMLLTGVVIMADWIASNQELFPLNPGLAESSSDRAENAWAAMDLRTGFHPSAGPEDIASAYSLRFDWPDERRPLPAQESMLRLVREGEGPRLICLEAPMGSGKTEAALVATEELARSTGRSGVIVAAPTMATSDALLTRVRRWAESAAVPGVPTSLFLGHSKAQLNEDMRTLQRQGLGVRNVGSDEGPSAVVAHQWLVGRKKGILSDVVVGTVDQVLFVALQSKHAMLRHLGLASKVVIIDECHAYSAYMNQYLARALYWLAAYGVPVVLLSATLPHSVKNELVSAYSRGLTARRHGPGLPPTGDAYPVVTVVDVQGARAHPVVDETPGTSVQVDFLGESDEELLSRFKTVESEGGCLLVLCNTVARAQHAYMLARTVVGDEARLLHARFMAADRVAKERDVVGEMGPAARRGSGRPHRRIVVATQVVEQSLDVDFDAMITDIAPMDLLLQRCGRVHRHHRPEMDRPHWSREPQVWIRGIAEEGTEHAPPVWEPTQEKIYSSALLLATYAMLSSSVAGTIVLPQDIPLLVSAVYEGPCPMPDSWGEAMREAQDVHRAKQADARKNAREYMFSMPQEAKVFRDLWKENSTDLGSEFGEVRGLAQVRDADPSLEILLTRKVPGGYQPMTWDEGEVIHAGLRPTYGQALAIAESSVRLPYRFSQPHMFDQAVEELERRTDAAWLTSPVLRGQLQLTLDEDGRAELAGVTLEYDQELGLREVREP